FVLGGDHQVLAGAGEGGGFAVDLHGLDGSVGEVEVDPVQVGGGPGVDGGDGAQGCVVAAGVVELQVVRRHVVAGVAQVREEAVADAQRGGGGARGDQADGDGRGEQRGGRAPPAGARDGGEEGAAVGGPAGGSERHAPRLSARAPATATTRFRRTRSGAPGTVRTPGAAARRRLRTQTSAACPWREAREGRAGRRRGRRRAGGSRTQSAPRLCPRRGRCCTGPTPGAGAC